jgi:aminoglycoside phosphotransferase (APT) family kinase protein
VRADVIDERLVFDAIEREVGARPQQLVQHETQLPRLVWEARFDARAPVVLKCEHEPADDGALVLEAWAMERAASVGIPVPRIIASDWTAALFPGRYAIFEFAPGRPIAPCWRAPAGSEIALADDAARVVWRSVGGHLRALHEISVAGYGRLDDDRYLATGDVRGRQSTWRAYSLAPAEEALAALRAGGALSPEECARISDFLASADDLWSYDDPRLLHGDLGAKHIWVDPATAALTSIIDWGDREAGDPAWDLAGIALWEDDARLEWTLEGYGADEAPRRRVLMYSLADGLRVAHKRYAQGRVDVAENTVTWLLPRVGGRCSPDVTCMPALELRFLSRLARRWRRVR